MPSFLVTPVSSSRELEEERVARGRGGKIAVIEVEGLLVNARKTGIMQPTENDVSLFVQQLEKAEKDSEVRAIVLRINSPGGTVSASDLMYDSVRRFKERSKKVVVASAQDLAASGGYYVACAADQIVVQPTSVVGSIGVIFQTMEFTGTMDKIGLKATAIKSGPLKDMGSPFKPLGDPEKVVMQQMVDEFYGRFKTVVKTARKMDDAQVNAIADGRVFTGTQAQALKMADQVGQLPDAIALAAKLAGTSDPEVVMYRRPYGYGGSIYATAPGSVPQVQNVEVNLLNGRAFLDPGFYYVWEAAVPSYSGR